MEIKHRQTSDMLSLGAEAVVGIVAVVSPQNRGIVCKLLTAHQVAQAVVAVQVHGADTVPGLRNAVELPVADVGIGHLLRYFLDLGAVVEPGGADSLHKLILENIFLLQLLVKRNG